MLNVFDVASTLVNHIKVNYREDIAIIAYYGSYAQGSASERSDLDFFFIPASSNGYHASIQFIIGDISFDFWPISWERAERMASFEESFTTIIADCKILYIRSDEDRERFMKLRDTISTLQEPKNGQKLLEKSEAELHDVYMSLYRMIRAGESDSIIYYRSEAQKVYIKVLQSLALLNQAYFTKGFGKNKEEILQYPLRPARLEFYMNTILRSVETNDILQACEQLTADTLELILGEKEKYTSAPSYPDRLKGFFEEVKGLLDKIITACEKKDLDTALFYAIHVQDEIAVFLYFAETGQWPSPLMTYSTYQDAYIQAGIPDLAALLNSHDLLPLKEGVQRLSSQLESHLRARGVEINRFPDLEQFEAFLKKAHEIG